MARSWKELKGALPRRAKVRMQKRTEAHETIVTLVELLHVRSMTQDLPAARLDRAQENISRTLRRADPHLSMLPDLIAGLGGELELIARFPDRSYALGFSEQETR